MQKVWSDAFEYASPSHWRLWEGGLCVHTFGYIAPTVWNSLPADLRASPSLPTFKDNLKMHLFCQAFWLICTCQPLPVSYSCVCVCVVSAPLITHSISPLIVYSISPLIVYCISPLIAHSISPLIVYSISPLIVYCISPLIAHSIPSAH